VDQRILNTVRTGQVVAKPGDNARRALSHAGYSAEAIQTLLDLIPKGIITDPSQVGGYPEYEGTPYKDSDHDGMPDDWETKYGLNPNDPSDCREGSQRRRLHQHREVHQRPGPDPKIDWSDPKNNVDPLMNGKLQASS
jgi:hypothetical protein